MVFFCATKNCAVLYSTASHSKFFFVWTFSYDNMTILFLHHRFYSHFSLLFLFQSFYLHFLSSFPTSPLSLSVRSLIFPFFTLPLSLFLFLTVLQHIVSSDLKVPDYATNRGGPSTLEWSNLYWANRIAAGLGAKQKIVALSISG